VNPFVLGLQDRAPRSATALSFDGESISYDELAARARRAAAWLAQIGVGSGDRVAALLPNGPPFVELLHGTLLRGAALVPMNTRLNGREIAGQLADADPAAFVHGEGELAARAIAAAAECGRAARCVAFAPARTGRALPPPPDADADPLVAIVYTSGTTGRAKGVLLGAAAFAASAAASRDLLGVRPGDRWLACLPLFHVGGLAILLRSVIDPIAVELHAAFDPDAVAARLASGEVQWASLVPTMLARVLRSDRCAASPRLRGVLLGGAAAPESLVAEALRRGIPIAPTYGLTEAASQVATRPPGEGGEGLTALPGNRLRIAGETGEILPAGAVGEIQVAGPTLMRGYFRRPEDGARALARGWLRTGDVGLLDSAGRLHVLARRTDLIVSGGENVYPAEVEAVIAEHPAVREVAVAGVPDAEFGARPAAWIVSDRAIEPDALRAWCRARLAGYKVPAAFHRIAELPRNAGGKVLRERLAGGA
jgi:O-succinylbenzoic acid--CoA ligase